MNEKFLTLEWENGDLVECEIIDRFEYKDKAYLVLNVDGEKESYIYGFTEDNDEISLNNLEKDEFDLVTKYYFNSIVK